MRVIIQSDMESDFKKCHGIYNIKSLDKKKNQKNFTAISDMDYLYMMLFIVGYL